MIAGRRTFDEATLEFGRDHVSDCEFKLDSLGTMLQYVGPDVDWSVLTKKAELELIIRTLALKQCLWCGGRGHSEKHCTTP